MVNSSGDDDPVPVVNFGVLVNLREAFCSQTQVDGFNPIQTHFLILIIWI